MNFTFTAEQLQLRDSVASYLERAYSFEDRQAIVRSQAGWSPEIWSRIVELGLTALPFPEECGGLGGSISDVVAVAEVFGARLLVEPYIGSIMMAGGALAAVPRPSEELARIVSGKAIGAFAYEEARGTADPSFVTMKAERTASGHALTGGKRMVLHGAAPDVLVVTARLDGSLALFLVAPRNSAATPFTTIDGRRAAHLRFDGAAATLLAANAEGLVRRVLQHTVVAMSAEAVGAMSELLSRTAEFASKRHQFGVAIGTFQTVAHRLADMKIAFIKARSTLLYTTALAEAGRLTSRDAAVLKAQVGRLGRFIGECAIQTHGGMGMTDELPIGHLHKRLLTFDALFGTAGDHLRALGAPAEKITA